MTLPLPVQGYLLGWAVAAPIGPVNIEIVRRGLRHGLAAGFGVGCGATLVDAGYMLLTSFGLAPFLGTRAVLLPCFVLGGAVMAVLASLALRDAIRCARGGNPLSNDSPAVPSTRRPWPSPRRPFSRSLLVGLAMTAANPMTIAFWATLPSLFFPGRIPGAGAILLASLAVWAGAFSWVLTLTVLMALGRRFVGPRLFAAVSALGGAAMACFALRFWWLAAHLETMPGRFGGA